MKEYSKNSTLYLLLQYKSFVMKKFNFMNIYSVRVRNSPGLLVQRKNYDAE